MRVAASAGECAIVCDALNCVTSTKLNCGAVVWCCCCRAPDAPDSTPGGGYSDTNGAGASTPHVGAAPRKHPRLRLGDTHADSNGTQSNSPATPLDAVPRFAGRGKLPGTPNLELDHEHAMQASFAAALADLVARGAVSATATAR